jgi:uridylate kinase
MINGLALQDALESVGCEARVLSSVVANQVCEPYIRRRAIRHLEKNRVVILSGGTGMPYFSTDTNSMTKASELNIPTVMFAKNGVDGVYDKDPNKFDDAKRYEKLTYSDMLEQRLQVMDLTAATMAEENELTSVVFNISEEGSLMEALNDETKGTVITK